MTIKVFGIDPGLAATGIGIVTGKNEKIFDYAFGTIKTPPHTTQGLRLETIYSRLSALIKDEHPELLVMEDVFSLDKYPQSGISLGKVCGVILLAAQQANVSVLEIAVREAKQVLTGNGKATKEQLEKAVRRCLGCENPIRPDHASDALGLALIGLFRYADGHLEQARDCLHSGTSGCKPALPKSSFPRASTQSRRRIGKSQSANETQKRNR